MEPRVVANGLRFPEGPLEMPGGDIVLVEIRGGVLTRVRPDGTKALFATTGGGPNGAALGPDAAVYVCNNGGLQMHERRRPDGSTRVFPGEQPDDYSGGRIERVTTTGEVTVLYRECNAEPLKGPNDIVFDAEGNFYFTDLGKTRPRARDRGAVHYASPDGKMIREIVFPMEMPNGIGLSPDGKTLYVAETATARLWAFTLEGPGQPANGRVLAYIPGVPPTYRASLDSLCVDGEGNILVATITNGGITSISPDGATQTFTPCGDPMTTNACFGGPDLRTLYVTVSSTGQMIAFDDWPTKGLKLHFQE